MHCAKRLLQAPNEECMNITANINQVVCCCLKQTKSAGCGTHEWKKIIRSDVFLIIFFLAFDEYYAMTRLDFDAFPALKI